jgi:hypothetical protein
VFFLAFGTVGTLGEYVFHWWHEPFEVRGPAGLVVGLARLGLGASSRAVRALHRELRGTSIRLAGQQDQMLGKQDQLIAGQAGQTALLRAMVASFRGR